VSERVIYPGNRQPLTLFPSNAVLRRGWILLTRQNQDLISGLRQGERVRQRVDLRTALSRRRKPVHHDENPHHTVAGQPFGGRFRDVILEHVTIDPVSGATRAVGDGRCLYVKDLAFDAVVPTSEAGEPTTDGGAEDSGTVGSSSGGGGTGSDPDTSSGGTGKGGGGGGTGSL
jgi:hypothetical protein